MPGTGAPGEHRHFGVSSGTGGSVPTIACGAVAGPNGHPRDEGIRMGRHRYPGRTASHDAAGFGREFTRRTSVACGSPPWGRRGVCPASGDRGPANRRWSGSGRTRSLMMQGNLVDNRVPRTRQVLAQRGPRRRRRQLRAPYPASARPIRRPHPHRHHTLPAPPAPFARQESIAAGGRRAPLGVDDEGAQLGRSRGLRMRPSSRRLTWV